MRRPAGHADERRVARARARGRRRRRGRDRRCAARPRRDRSGRRSRGGSTRVSAARRGSQSASVRAIGPAWSRLGASGTMPRIETAPRVGLIVDVPHIADGMRSEPAVSVPVAAGVMRGGERRRGTAARPAGGTVEGPRVADLVGRAAGGELVRVQVAEQHHPCVREPFPRVGVARGNVVEYTARCGERLSRDGVKILHSDRNAAERAAASPRARALVGARGRGERVLLVHANPCVDRARVAVEAAPAVALADARKARLDELARRGVTLRSSAADASSDTEVCGARRSRVPIYTRPRGAAHSPPVPRRPRRQPAPAAARCCRRATTTPPGKIDAAELRAIEDDAIREVVRMQEEVGLQSRPTASSAARRGTWTSSTSSTASRRRPARSRSSSTTRAATSSSRRPRCTSTASSASRRRSSATTSASCRRR